MTGFSHKSRGAASSRSDAIVQRVPGKRTLVEESYPSVQRKVGANSTAPAATGTTGATGMPAAVQAKMENAFGSDFSGVRIHEGPQADAIGAQAYTQGTDIHFAPGQYAPNDQAGQELSEWP